MLEIKNDSDFQDMIINSLRYSLGRRTYVTNETAEFIMKHPEIVTERVCIVMLRDIDRYRENRELWQYKDDQCDYNTWIGLQNWLFKLAKEKNYNVVGYERR